MKIHPKIEEARFWARFERLWDLCEKQKADLRANPGPYIHKAYEEVIKTRKLLREIKYQLLGPLEPFDGRAPIDFEPIESKLMRRHNKVLKLIKDFENEDGSG